MNSALRLVAPTVPGRMPHPPRVMTESFKQQLATLNHATRELRELGLHVVWSRLNGDKPRAHIRRDATVSITPLLDRMGPRTYSRDDETNCTVVCGVFKGVQVSWIESA